MTRIGSARTLIRLAAIACFLVVATLSLIPSAASTVQHDGSLPMYPNATLESGGQAVAVKAFAMGFAAMMNTNDAPAVVVAWYRSHLPSSYSQHTTTAGTQFKGSGGVVNIVIYKGRTLITLVPDSSAAH